jgi:hypothetical protein
MTVNDVLMFGRTASKVPADSDRAYSILPAINPLADVLYNRNDRSFSGAQLIKICLPGCRDRTSTGVLSVYVKVQCDRWFLADLCSPASRVDLQTGYLSVKR